MCGGRLRIGNEVAAADVDRLAKGEGDGLPGNSPGEIAFVGHDTVDAAAHARGQHDDFIARLDAAAQHGAGIAAETRPSRLIHCTASRNGRASRGRALTCLEVMQQGRAAIPRHGGTLADDIVAEQRRDRDGGDRGQAKSLGHRRVGRDDLLKAAFLVVHQVHLVDGQHDLPDAHQGHDRAVPVGLPQHALGRVDQDHRQIGGGRTRRHVARVLLVSRRVGDDEATPRGREETVADIDGDALFALRLQAIDQQREIRHVAEGAVVPAVAGQGRQMVIRNDLGVEQQAADQRALAVVDAAAGDEPQHVLAVGLGREGYSHQK